MNIGIVTQPLNGNFGGIMQNFALQCILKKMGHNPITIDFMSTIPWHLFILTSLKSFVLLFTPKRRKFLHRKFSRPQISEQFINRFINKTPIVHRYKTSLIHNYDLDCIIVGSDQVWRPSYNQFLEDMFLKFAKNAIIKRIAYGASFGVDKNEYTDKEIQRVKPLVDLFNAISVREESGQSIVYNNFGKAAQIVLDPTLLLKREQYLEIIGKAHSKSIPILGAYILDGDTHTTKLIKDTKELLGIKTSKIITNAPEDISVEEWLCLFRDAEFIITDSFHGTVFSIIFQKPFVTIANRERGNSRFISLLKSVNLTNRIIYENSDNLEKIIADKIDWNRVIESLDILRTKSIDFLNAIN